MERDQGEVRIRLPKEEYNWTLYDAESCEGGFRAVYGHESGAWLAIRPDAKPPQHEAQLFHPDATIDDWTEINTQSLIHFIEQSVPVRRRDEINEGEEAEAYDFAVLN